MPKRTALPPLPAFDYWDFPSDMVVREQPPGSISDDDRSRFESTLRAGIDTLTETDGRDELFAVIGLDFGTSSTKAIVRFPYEAGEPTIAIPAPEACSSDGDAYLWQTAVWLTGDGTFWPWPEPKAAAVRAIKQGLIGGSREELTPIDVPVEVSRAQIAAAYLAFVIRYVKGWLVLNRPALLRRRKPVWFVNIGMPTASFDDQAIAAPYRQVAAAALQLAKINAPVTVDAAEVFLHDAHVTAAGQSEESAEALGIAVFPETAAEMAGFAKSTRNAPGLYLLVDVGAMTLDACVFRLQPDVDQGEKYSFMAAQIRPLGVDSFHWFLTHGKVESDFIAQCDRTLRTVVWHTKQRRDRSADTWKPGADLPVFWQAEALAMTCIGGL